MALITADDIAKLTEQHGEHWRAYKAAGQPEEGPAAEAWTKYVQDLGWAAYDLFSVRRAQQERIDACDHGNPSDDCGCEGCMLEWPLQAFPPQPGARALNRAHQTKRAHKMGWALHARLLAKE